MDVLELPPTRDGYNELLVFCDNLSRYIEAKPFKGVPTAEQVLDAFVELILTRYGTPSEIRSDRGSDLIADLSKQFYELCGVKMVTSTSHHHKGVPSQAERIQSTLLGLARATHGGYPGDWKDMLPFLLFSIRAIPSRVTKASPAELLYGWTPCQAAVPGPEDTGTESRAVPVSALPVRAKFERGTWFYLTQQRRPNGRLAERWYPALAFDATELASDEFGQLRADHLGGLGYAEAAAVLAVHCVQCREDMGN